jgi:DNA-binding MarR family transcriptional regulator
MATGRSAATDELVRAAAFRAELRRFLRQTVEVASRFDLTAQRYDLLLMIRASGDRDGMTITDLGERLQLRQTAVTELVARAVAAGLVERSRSADDRRVRLVRITPEGERRLLGAFAALSTDRAALVDAFLDLGRRFRDAHG